MNTCWFLQRPAELSHCQAAPQNQPSVQELPRKDPLGRSARGKKKDLSNPCILFLHFLAEKPNGLKAFYISAQSFPREKNQDINWLTYTATLIIPLI